jgi:hypothetical protein
VVGLPLLINLRSKQIKMSDIKIDAESFYSKITKLYNTWKNPKNVRHLHSLTFDRVSMTLTPF